MTATRTAPDTGAQLSASEPWLSYGGAPHWLEAYPCSDGQGSNPGVPVNARLQITNGTTWERQREANKAAEVAISVTAGTPVALVTPAAGKKVRVMGYALSASAACSITLRYGAAATLLLRLPKAGPDVPVFSDRLGNGLITASANDTIKIDVSADATVTGYLLYLEE